MASGRKGDGRWSPLKALEVEREGAALSRALCQVLWVAVKWRENGWERWTSGLWAGQIL